MSSDNLNPNGFCPKCRMSLIKMDGERKCPNCSSESINPNMIINNVEDPGDLNMQKILNGGRVDPKFTSLPAFATNQKVTLVPKNSNPFEHIDSQLKNAKFENMNDAKKILKLRKKLNDLKFEIEMFLGGS